MKLLVLGLFLSFFIGNLFLNTSTFCADKKEEYLLPGNIKEGWKVFNTKNCILCHSIWGEGGKGGPDLSILPKQYVSQSQLVALMWNHAPEMLEKMSLKRITFKKIDTKEMADLFAFLYFIRYMDEPGDPNKGRTIIEKNCIYCHSSKDEPKVNLSKWAMYVNPILWAQMMWNHTAKMENEMEKKGIKRMEFKGNDMVDLISYIRSLNPKAEKIYLPPGDPISGERLFNQKGCIKCHSSSEQLDLSKKKEFPKTLSQLAGVMWNHSYEMWKQMAEKGIERPLLSPQEMSDIVAYLFSLRYFDEPGNPDRGKIAFSKKQCSLCHTKGKEPDLTFLKGKLSPILMAQIMWNHLPQMLEKMRRQRVKWQKINGEEMVDLMEYINRGMP